MTDYDPRVRRGFQLIADALRKIVDVDMLVDGFGLLLRYWHDQELRIARLEREVEELKRVHPG